MDLTWACVEEALAAGADLEAFIPKEVLQLHSTFKEPSSPQAGLKLADLETAAPSSPVQLANPVALPAKRDLTRWQLVNRLRQTLAAPAACLELPPEITAQSQRLSALDWGLVFEAPPLVALPVHLPLASRAALPGPASCLRLLAQVPSRGLALFTLCCLLPALCSLGPELEHCSTVATGAAGVAQQLRVLTGLAVKLSGVLQLTVKQVQQLLQTLGLKDRGEVGRLVEAEVRLRYFAGTAVYPPEPSERTHKDIL